MATPISGRLSKDRPEGISRFWDDLVVSPYREFLNFVGDTGRWLGSRPQHEYGKGIGDTHPVIGTTKAPASGRSDVVPNFLAQTKKIAQDLAKRAPKQEEPKGPRDILSALSEAFGLVGGGNNISYDPLRNDARSRAAEYDARIKAMYDQLAGSIRDDAAGIQQNFQGAMDSTAERSEDIQGKVQAAHDAAQERNLQQAQALGIEEAMGNIMSRGQDINTQAASRVSDVAERGQITSDRLERGKQASLAHNTNLAGAAGLEGNLQRSRIGNELSSLLAQYDMEEQAANQQARQNSFSQALGLAQAIVGDDWQRQTYQDDLERFIWEQNNQQAPGPDPVTLQLLYQLLGEEPDPDLFFKGYSSLRPRS